MPGTGNRTYDRKAGIRTVMKQIRDFKKITVTPKQEKSVRNGHPWIYEDEITGADSGIENGSIVDVFGQKGNWLGSGFWSQTSKIRVRLLSDNANETFGEAFFRRKVQYAVQYRRDVMQDDFEVCRLIHGEADGLPGLTVDRYHNILVSEVASCGTQKHIDVIYDALREMIPGIEGIYERNESPLRLKEGLPQYKGWYGDTHPDTCIFEIEENGIRYEIDVENGQKTGFFLDQKYNRLAAAKIARGRRVLDCCTHIGSFALNAAKAGASYVCAMDISESALENARRNARHNGLQIDTVQGDVFEVLPQMIEDHARFDMIILDPPAFTKSRKTFANARNGYRRINRDAMRLLKRGGYLATCSCSHFMPKEEFIRMICDAAKDAGVSVRIIEQRGAAPDHPVLPAVPETEYLKFVLLQII